MRAWVWAAGVSRPVLAAPVGVTVVPEGEEAVARAPEMQRLLRQPRCVLGSHCKYKISFIFPLPI